MPPLIFSFWILNNFIIIIIIIIIIFYFATNPRMSWLHMASSMQTALMLQCLQIMNLFFLSFKRTTFDNEP